MNFILKNKLKTYFVTGLLVTGPIGFTLIIVRAVVGSFDNVFYQTLPRFLHPENLLGFRIPGLGFMVAILIIMLIGMLAANVIGRYAVNAFEKLINHIPLIKSIYNLFKQVADTTLGKDRKGFRQVVLIEYPRKGIWSIGFVTGITKGEIQRITEHKMINVFLPTTPNPTSGFYILVPEEEAINLQMTVDEAFKLIISGGMVTPQDKGDEQAQLPPRDERQISH